MSDAPPGSLGFSNIPQTNKTRPVPLGITHPLALLRGVLYRFGYAQKLHRAQAVAILWVDSAVPGGDVVAEVLLGFRSSGDQVGPFSVIVEVDPQEMVFAQLPADPSRVGAGEHLDGVFLVSKRKEGRKLKFSQSRCNAPLVRSTSDLFF